jgi:hypothetical protein
MTPEYEFKSKNRSFMTSRRLTEDHYAVSLPNPEKCAAGKRRIVKRQKILKSSIPSPFRRRCSQTPDRSCHSPRTPGRCFLLFGRAVIFGRKDFRSGPELQGMKPEGESIKPDDKNEDGSKDIDTEDIDSDKAEGDELKQEKYFTDSYEAQHN